MLYIFTYQNAYTKGEIWQLSIRLMRFGNWFCYLNRDFFFLFGTFVFFYFLQDNWYGFSHDMVRCILLLELWNFHQTDVFHLCRWLIVFDFVSFFMEFPISNMLWVRNFVIRFPPLHPPATGTPKTKTRSSNA